MLLDEEGRGALLDVFGKGVPVSSLYLHIYFELASPGYASSRDILHMKRLK